MAGVKGFVRGLLLWCWPLTVLGASALYHPNLGMREDASESWWLAGSLAVALAGAFAATALRVQPRLGRWLGTATVLAAMTGAGPALAQRPAAALCVLLGGWAILCALWSWLAVPAVAATEQPVSSRSDRGVATGACVAALCAWVVPVMQWAEGDAAWWAVSAALAGAAAGATRQLVAQGLPRWGSVGGLLVTAAVAVVAAFWPWHRPEALANWLALAAAALALATHRLENETSAPSHGTSGGTSWWEPLFEHQARLLAVTFLGLAAAGTLLLTLPVCSTGRNGLSLVDAAFTALSATCVTGLIVADTAKDLSTSGQAVVLLLIQLGGLGIMTFYTAAVALLGGRLSLRQEGAMAGLVSGEHRRDLFRALRQVLLLTAAAEVAGTVALAALFATGGEGWPTALWRALFTAISAFCNAGFALQSDSLMGYSDRPVVLHVVAILVILGGLGPAVVTSLPSLMRGGRVSLQARLALTSTALLLVLGTAFVLAFEWSNALAHLSGWDRLHNAWFQSVTLRTAGFNSVDFGHLRSATTALMVLMMFVGGCPGSTAGGIKTTTAALLVLAIRAALQGGATVVSFGRRVTPIAVYKAAAVATLGALCAIVAVLAIDLTQSVDAEVALFEVVSALGTVGLSLGGTAMLDEAGKVIIMICMFAGRVGPLTLFLLLADRSPRRAEWVLLQEDVAVG